LIGVVLGAASESVKGSVRLIQEGNLLRWEANEGLAMDGDDDDDGSIDIEYSFGWEKIQFRRRFRQQNKMSVSDLI
jgi:hypothetical protein